MFVEPIPKLREKLEKANRPFRLFFDNAQIVDSVTDAISWDDDNNVLHVIRLSQDRTFQHEFPVEVLMFHYEDIRSFSYYIKPDELSEVFASLTSMGAKGLNEDKAKLLTKYFKAILE